jgi:translocation and assembly module TamB
MTGRRARIVLWALGLPVGLASGLILALWLYAGGEGGRVFMLHQWQDQARQSLGAELTVESLEGNPLTSLRARGIRLEREGRTLARVAEMELTHNPLALLGGRLRLGRLRLIRPEVDLPLPPAPASSGGPGLALTISELEVQGGRLTAGGGLGPLTAVEGVELTGSLASDPRGLLVEAKMTRADLVLAGAARPIQATGRAEVTGQGLNLKILRLDDGVNSLEAAGELSWAKAPHFSLSLRGLLAKAGELPWPWPGPRVPASPLSLQASLRGDPERAELHASLGQGSAAGEAARLELQGELAWRARRLTAQGRLAGLDLASLGLTPWPAGLGGVLGLELAAGEDWAQFKRARLDLELDQVHLAGQAPARASLAASWEPGALKVASLNLHAPWGAVEGSGQALWTAPGQPPEISAAAGFSDLTWPTGLAPEPPAGLAPLAAQARLRGHVEAKGRPADLAWHLDLERSQIALGLEIARLAARGGLRGTQWRLESLELAGEGLELAARGAATASGAEAEFSLKLAQLARLADPLRTAGLALPTPLAGEVAAQGRIKGTWEAPGLSLKAQLRGVDLPGFTAAQADLLLESERLGLPVTGQVKLTLLKHRHGDWYFERAQLEGQAGPGGIGLSASAQGPDLKAALRLSGPASPAWPLGLRLEGLSLTAAGRPAWQQAGRASLTLTAQALAVQDLVLTQGDQRLSLEGSLGPNGAVSGGLGLSKLRLGPWLPVRGLAREPRLEAQAKLGGSLASPSLELSGRLSDLAWANLPPSEARLAGEYAGGLLSLQGQALTQGASSLELAAELGLDLSLLPPRFKPNSRGLHASLKAPDLPMALLEPALPGVSDLGGRLELDLQAEGSLEAPRLQGHLALRQGAFTVGATSQAFRDIDVRLGLKGRELTVEQFQLASGGPVRLTGRVELPLGGPGLADLELTAQGFHVSLANLGEVVTDARLKLAGDLEHLLLTGLLTPRRAVIQPRLATPDIQRDVVILKRGQKPPPVRREVRRAPRIQLEGPLLAPLVMDVDMVMTPELKIKVGEGYLEMLGTASVRKQPGGPLTFHGGSQVPRGAIVVQGKRFEITDGSTDLRGKDRPDPDLSAKATLRLGTSLVLASVSGTAYETLIDLSSEPPMSQTDILSTIIFGRPASALNAGETRQLSAQALALMGQRGRREIEKFLGPTLAPDVVTVHNEIQTGSSLEAGKYLSPDLYLRYRQNMGQEGGQNVGLELRLKPYLSLESQLGTTRDNGVDVIFSFDFD